METSKLNETLKMFEDAELTLEKAKEIFEDEGKLEADEVKPMKLKTMFDEYDCFGDDLSWALIKADKFQKFVKDMCEEFASKGLPDKFDYYFSVETMYDDIMDKGWKVVLYQAQRWLENLGEDDFTSIQKYDVSFDDCYLIELI